MWLGRSSDLATITSIEVELAAKSLDVLKAVIWLVVSFTSIIQSCQYGNSRLLPNFSPTSVFARRTLVFFHVNSLTSLDWTSRRVAELKERTGKIIIISVLVHCWFVGDHRYTSEDWNLSDHRASAGFANKA